MNTKYCITFLAIVVSIVSLSCSGSNNIVQVTGGQYVYSYSMEQPEQNTELKFRDTNIEIQFTIDNAAITFQMLNNSDQQLSIVWERVSLGINKRTYSVRNINTFYAAGSFSPQPLVVPSKGFIRETVIPWQNSYLEKGKWKENDLFLTRDSGSQKLKGIIEAAAGNELTLVLPLRIGKIVIDYSFIFKVTGVKLLSPDASPPAKERPPMPELPLQESGIFQNYLPIIISAGILGVAAILFSQKKAPTNEL